MVSRPHEDIALVVPPGQSRDLVQTVTLPNEYSITREFRWALRLQQVTAR